MRIIGRLLLVIMCIATIALAADYYFSDGVKNEFAEVRKLLPMDAESYSHIHNVYVCYKIDEDTIEKLLKYPSQLNGFGEWTKFDSAFVLGPNIQDIISGNDVLRSMKSGSTEWNQISIYINLDKKLVYFCRILTS